MTRYWHSFGDHFRNKAGLMCQMYLQNKNSKQLVEQKVSCLLKASNRFTFRDFILILMSTILHLKEEKAAIGGGDSRVVGERDERVVC